MGAALPLMVLGGFLVLDLHVFWDAANHARDGDPVTVSIGSFTLESPGEWLVA